jgi:predicted Zn-dependent peptidase
LAIDTIQTHEFENGLVLIGESMDWLESAAFTLVVPAGAAHDPAGRFGLSSFTCEMAQRGCGPRNSRQFIEDLENRGVDHNSNTGILHSSFSAAMLADHLEATLGIFADVLRRPHLPADQLEDARQVCLHEIRAVEDELGQKTMLELRRLRYADPWGRAAQGKFEDVAATTIADVRSHFERSYQPAGSILAVAGKFHWQRLVDRVGQLLGDWKRRPEPAFTETAPTQRHLHIPCDSSQIHLGIAYPSVPYRHADYYHARGAVGVLSDGMSSRLFTEVRENRGLCYSIYAS